METHGVQSCGSRSTIPYHLMYLVRVVTSPGIRTFYPGHIHYRLFLYCYAMQRILLYQKPTPSLPRMLFPCRHCPSHFPTWHTTSKLRWRYPGKTPDLLILLVGLASWGRWCRHVIPMSRKTTMMMMGPENRLVWQTYSSVWLGGAIRTRRKARATMRKHIQWSHLSWMTNGVDTPMPLILMHIYSLYCFIFVLLLFWRPRCKRWCYDVW